jgi:phthalate 4,5-dioxygenase oxygenase subunit
MLSKEDNDLLTRVGPGTPMGAVLREYWLPMIFSSELPEPDCKPLRVRLLGEDLVAFRDSEGRIGLLEENCAHRGASLAFGRNEGCGLRCVYHGWKFDVNGACVDMPNEPPESNFKDKVRQRAYKCAERRGVIWAYMGPRETPPPLPDLEWNVLPEEQTAQWKALRECNWVQALEGDIDTSHLYILHSRLNEEDDPSFGVYHPDKHPRLEIVSTDYGVMYGARRDEDDEHYYWRITQFMLPFHVFFPPSNTSSVPGHIWVPLDDHHTMAWTVLACPTAPLSDADRARNGFTGSGEYLPPAPDGLGRWRLGANKRNDYLQDFEVQRTRNYTGIKSIFLQDQMVTESMGPIYDRSKEHLGASDAMIIQVRRRLLELAKALRDRGTTPDGVDTPESFRVRSASVVLRKDEPWVEASREAVRAFSGLPVSAA